MQTPVQGPGRLDLDRTLQCLPLLILARNGLGTHDSTTPVTLGLLVIRHVSILDGGDKLGELILVLLSNLGEG